DIVKQRTAARHVDVEAELRGHDPREPGDFLRMLENVLPVARSPAHSADELHEFGVQPVHAGVICRLFSRLEDLRVDFLTRLRDDFLDSTRMNSPVGYQFLERETRDLATNWIEARHYHRIGRVVDDDVDTRRELERANISTFPADD